MSVMYTDLFVRLAILVIITIFLLKKRQHHNLKQFSYQTWSAKDTLPFYWLLVFISLTGFILYKAELSTWWQVIVTDVTTLAGSVVLLITIRFLLGEKKKRLPEVIGFNARDVYWFSGLVIVEYVALVAILLGRNGDQYFYALLLPAVYLSMTIIFWPIIEDVFFLGMMFIPVSRTVRLAIGAVLVSLLRTIPHFAQNGPQLLLTFLIFGLLGCYLYIRSGRIVVPLVLHSGINFAVIVRKLGTGINI